MRFSFWLLVIMAIGFIHVESHASSFFKLPRYINLLKKFPLTKVPVHFQSGSDWCWASAAVQGIDMCLLGKGYKLQPSSLFFYAWYINNQYYKSGGSIDFTAWNSKALWGAYRRGKCMCPARKVARAVMGEIARLVGIPKSKLKQKKRCQNGYLKNSGIVPLEIVKRRAKYRTALYKCSSWMASHCISVKGMSLIRACKKIVKHPNLVKLLDSRKKNLSSALKRRIKHHCNPSKICKYSGCNLKPLGETVKDFRVVLALGRPILVNLNADILIKGRRRSYRGKPDHIVLIIGYRAGYRTPNGTWKEVPQFLVRGSWGPTCNEIPGRRGRKHVISTDWTKKQCWGQTGRTCRPFVCRGKRDTWYCKNGCNYGHVWVDANIVLKYGEDESEIRP